MLRKYRLGVDAGGTFTDFVLADDTGDVRLYKSSSTPGNPTDAIADGLAQISADLGRSVKEILSECDLCINGTTVALNALIQHKGAKVGLLATAGHEDSLEIRLGHKEEGHRYDDSYPQAVMLAPRYLRRPVRERVLSDGSVRTPLNEDDVREACAYFRKEGAEAVAISYVWSILNPAHERRTAEIVRQELPDVFVSVGTEVYPQTREYTRGSTTVVNAYLGPLVERYVADVDNFMREQGLEFPVRYYQSNGGLANGAKMADRAVYAINSGPAAGPAAGLYIGEPLDHDSVITVDMGGTSFDVTLTHKGKTNVRKNEDFLRYRLGVPMLHVETLGAGGGSIAHLDSLGVLKVGPESAGAEPGPACYGRGGTRPTVTDANLVLGYVNPTSLLGGAMKLDRDAAVESIKQHVAKPLGLSVEEAAWGIYTIVNSNMFNGIRRLSVEKGYDPLEFVLIAAGGAGPAHVTALAREMGINTVLVPKLASGLCAFGQIISDVKYNYLATSPMQLDADTDLKKLNGLFEDMEEEGIENLKSDGFNADDISIQRSVDMRYIDQIHECPVDIDSDKISAKGVKKIRHAFDQRHEQLFTYSEPHNTAEIVNLESTIIGRVSKPQPPRIETGEADASPAILEQRPMIFDRSGKAAKNPVYDGAMLKAGNVIDGPAVIEEVTTTIVIEPGWRAKLDERGTYMLNDIGA
jgi:N-methylhydantoinase A